LGIIPVSRKQADPNDARKRGDVLDPIVDALDEGSIVIFFPEGTRGRAGQIGQFKRGIQGLAKRCPGVPIVPLYLAGFSMVHPKGSHLPLPLVCSITVGEAVIGKTEDLPDELRNRVVALGGDDALAAGASSSALIAARRET
jgi:1-acyl-sn-glycerol-3-phosphate acyltransferase